MLGAISMTRRKAVAGISSAAIGVVGLSGLSSGVESEERPSAGERASDRSQEAWDMCVPADYDSIQAAVDAASEGARIGVAAGKHDGGVQVRTAGVTLEAMEGARPIIDASGTGTGVVIRAKGVTVEGFEIAGDGGTTSGISINTSAGATSDITIRNNHIHGMKKAGGGGRFDVTSWGILSFGNAPLSGVRIEGNHIEDIGGSDGDGGWSYQDVLGDPIGIGIDLEEVAGDRHGAGAVVRNNKVSNIHDGSISSVTVPGIGIAVQPLDGNSSNAGAPATDVTRNAITGTAFNVLLGNTEHVRVWENTDRL
jgi:hypothetical protein